MSREASGDWVKFIVRIVNSFKHPGGKMRRRDELIWAPISDLSCNCPKIGLHKTYLIAGMAGKDSVSGPGSIVLDRDSVVLLWDDQWLRRLKQFARDQLRGKC